MEEIMSDQRLGLRQITSGSGTFLILDSTTTTHDATENIAMSHHRDNVDSVVWVLGTVSTHEGENHNHRTMIPRDTNNTCSGLSEEDIEKCLTKTRNPSSCGDRLDHKGEEICAICLDDTCREEEKDETAANIGILDCGHEYHVCCIKRWLRLKNFCPLCKAVAYNIASCQQPEID